MDTLWAPWRMAYIGGPKESGCIFCEKPLVADRASSLVLASNPRTTVMLNKFPYANGHLMVAPRRHTADLLALDAADHAALAEMLRQAIAIVRREFRPDGVNVGMNLGAAAGAGVADHLHWHIVPRWVGDTNFMPLIGEVRVIPEHLQALHARLLPLFAAYDGD